MRPVRNNNPQKRKSAFFDHFIRQSGEDFLTKENYVSIKRKATMFFRDMANGTFDVEKHGQYLSNDYLLNIMLNEALIKLKYYSIHYKFAMTALQADPSLNGDEAQLAIRSDYDSLSAYSTIYAGLIDLLQTKNLGYLPTIANKMRQLKYNL